MRTAIGDTETKSALNLREDGSYTYASHESTDVICFVVAVENQEPEVWTPTNPNPAVVAICREIAADPKNWEFVFHNVMFDRAVYDYVLVARYNFPPIGPEAWRCSQRLALANAYPAELDRCALALGLPYRKDPDARKAMLRCSRPMQSRKRKKGAHGDATKSVPVFSEDAADLALVIARCVLDTTMAGLVWRSPKLRRLSAQERHYELQDAIIASRGIRLDRAFAEAARALAIHERTAINLRLQELTTGAITSVDQNQRFLRAINQHGHAMTSMTKRSVAQILANKPDGFVRELLELRRAGARASIRKFDRMLAFASPVDDRMRGTLRMYGAGPGRWSGMGPQLQNIRKNEANLPLSVVDSIRAGDRSGIAQFGNPLSLLGDISRAALCAAPGFELKSADYSAIESVILAWFAQEKWKLLAYRDFIETGDKQREIYRVIVRKMLGRADDAAIDNEERNRIGKPAELSCGFGGSVGAWRRIVPHDARSDEELRAVIRQWRDAHPATVKFWKELARSIRVAMRTGKPILVAPAPQPPLIADFAGGTLTLTLPSGRAISYPEARFVPSRYEDSPPDVQFMDNAKGAWKPVRGWFGSFVENVIQGTARDLLAAAIERFESRGLAVVLHVHDEVTCEVPAGSLSDAEFLSIMLTLPAWATGMPVTGKVHSGAHYLPAPEPGKEAKPIEHIERRTKDDATGDEPEPEDDDAIVEEAVEAYLDDFRADIGQIDDPEMVEADDDLDFVGHLPDDVAPLTDLVSLPMTSGNKVSCPFHDDPEPSCMIYADHWHCFGCGERGDRMAWLMRAEGMTMPEAIAFIKDWASVPKAPRSAGGDAEPVDKLTFAKSIWDGAVQLRGSIAEQYLAETRQIDTTRLPSDVHRNLRFAPRCVFGSSIMPCLIALMRDPVTLAPCGIHRTALEAQGGGDIVKVDRKMLGRAGIVTLWPAGKRLVVGEGLETVLTAATRLSSVDMPLIPAWAMLSSHKFGTFPLIPSVEELIVLADNDEPGIEAVTACKRRWEQAGRTVVWLMPSTPGTDFNDFVTEKKNAAA